jgi:hypothetical protein
MATNTFKNVKSRLVGATAVTLLSYGSGATQQGTLIGCTLCNRTANIVKGSAYITDTGGDTYLVDSIEIAPGQTECVVGGDQKIVLLANDAFKVKCDTASGLDVILSYLEMTP